MKLNYLTQLSLLVILLGMPAGVFSAPESAIAQQSSKLNFRNIRFASLGMQTSTGGGGSKTTITLSIQNYSGNSYSFTNVESTALSLIELVDSKNNTYFGQFEGDLNKPFFNGENRIVKLHINHPMGIYPKYLKLRSGDLKQPIYIPL